MNTGSSNKPCKGSNRFIKSFNISMKGLPLPGIKIIVHLFLFLENLIRVKCFFSFISSPASLFKLKISCIRNYSTVK